MPVGGSNKLLGCRELADRLDVPERTVRGNWRRWGLTAYRVGRAIRFRKRDIEDDLLIQDKKSQETQLLRLL